MKDDERCRRFGGSISRRGFLAGSALAATSAAGLTAAPASQPGEPSTGRRIRIGVVGGGFGSCFPWHEHPDAVVAAVSDLLPDRRDHLMKTFKCPTAYESLEKLILAKDIDAVSIFTPAPDHARHVEMVLNSGKHAISAVPLAMSIEECERVLETVKRTGLTYMMAETSFYRQETITARQWYKAGKFGEITYVEGEYLHDHMGFNLKYWHSEGGPTWRYGFPPMHYPTHSTAFLTGVTGERIVEVACMGWGDDDVVLKKNKYNNPFWNCTALCRTNRGHYANMSVFWAVQCGFAERADWFGTKMSYCMPHPNKPKGTDGMITTSNGPPTPQPLIEHWKTDMLPEPLRHDSGHGGAWTFIVNEFIDSLVKRRRPAVDIYEALAETVPGIVAHQSALKRGELMKVPQCT